jgi:hypothetical protein
MRIAIAAAALACAPALVSAQTFDFGLKRVDRTVTIAEDGHLLVTGVARAGLRSDGEVGAVLTIDGEECARSTARDATGVATATASCLVPVKAGATHRVRLVETNLAGVSRRSSLTTDMIADPTALNVPLGQATGQKEAMVSIETAVETPVTVKATVDVIFGACEDCPSGRTGIGSIEAVYDLGEGWQTCFNQPFNRLSVLPDRQTCEFTVPAGRRARVVMSAIAAEGASIGRAILGATGPVGDGTGM